MAAVILLAWAFTVWIEVTGPWGAAAPPPARYVFATLDECRAARDLAILLSQSWERVTGCEEET